MINKKTLIIQLTPYTISGQWDSNPRLRKTNIIRDIQKYLYFKKIL